MHLQFACVLCKPKETVVKAHASSLFNLMNDFQSETFQSEINLKIGITYIKNKQSTRAKQFEEIIKAGSSRGKHLNKHSSKVDEPPEKKAQIQLPFTRENLANRRGRYSRNAGSHKEVL